MSQDDLLQNPTGLTRQLLNQAQRRGARLAAPTSRHITALAEVASHRFAPHLEELVEWITSESNIDSLQSTLSKVANTAISMGFRIDPGAALLFEFASWLEEEHGKEAIIPRVLAHSPLEDGSLLGLLTRSLTSSPDASPHTQDTDVRRVRQHMLLMLCSLAQLDEETPLPEQDDIDSLHGYLSRAILPEQFDLLADLAIGNPEAFDTLQRRHHDTQHAKRDTASTRDRIKHALLDRIVPIPNGRETPEAHTPSESSALVRSQARTPALTFLTTSYLLFLQTTLTRSMLESFPNMIASLKQAEQEEIAQQQASDAIDMSSP